MNDCLPLKLLDNHASQNLLPPQNPCSALPDFPQVELAGKDHLPLRAQHPLDRGTQRRLTAVGTVCSQPDIWKPHRTFRLQESQCSLKTMWGGDPKGPSRSLRTSLLSQLWSPKSPVRHI